VAEEVGFFHESTVEHGYRDTPVTFFHVSGDRSAVAPSYFTEPSFKFAESKIQESAKSAALLGCNIRTIMS
jgi:hypothetical protein